MYKQGSQESGKLGNPGKVRELNLRSGKTWKKSVNFCLFGEFFHNLIAFASFLSGHMPGISSVYQILLGKLWKSQGILKNLVRKPGKVKEFCERSPGTTDRSNYLQQHSRISYIYVQRNLLKRELGMEYIV